ncbi:MAG: T9SS type A sorting domain-containing protein [Saprospiraceae bacterium]|nr:T9SS type A sorting domain-containing protein [Saprospiraceae bacterium]MBP7699322.1 T9SS type A sorting domain-containing protein [Saprospiraceae bacterium]
MKTLQILFMFLSISCVMNAQIVNFNVGQTVPNFTVTDLENHSHTLYDYTSQGKYVMLDFYAHWCGPCCETAPIINEFYIKYGCNTSNVIVLGIELDGTIAQTEGFETNCLAGADKKYPVASGLGGGGSAVHSTFGAAAFPTITLIGPDNKLLNSDIWPINNVGDMEEVYPANVLTPTSCALSTNTILSQENIAIYPNPSNENVNIALQLFKDANVSIEIYNTLGQLIRTEQFGKGSNFSRTLSVRELNNGIYTLKIKADTEIARAQLNVLR